MARLPNPGADSGQWGNVLNDFLGVAHNADGTLKDTAFVADGSITTVKLADGAVTNLKIDPALIDPAAGVAGLRTLGNGANQAMPGNATVTPGAHAASHKGGGSDPIDTATTTVAGLMSGADKTKLDGVTAGADVTNATTVNAAGAVMESDTSTAAMQFVIDEDSMVSNSATKVPTQQSVKAYVDATGNGDVSGPGVVIADNLVSFSGTTGKIIKDSGKAAPTGAIVGDSDAQTLTNKSISGLTNTITNLPNGALTNSTVTVGSTSIALGATAATVAGLTLTTPTIASFTNAQHNHTNGAGGGQITDAALSTQVSVAKGGTGNTTATTAYGLQAAGTTATGAHQTLATGSSGQILKSNGANALPTFQTGAPTDVGLDQVNNTSDANKPVSTLQAASIATKPTWLGSGLNASRPAASAGAGLWLSTDINGGTQYYSNGTTWSQLGAGVLDSGGQELAYIELNAFPTTGNAWSAKDGFGGQTRAFTAGTPQDITNFQVSWTPTDTRPVEVKVVISQITIPTDAAIAACRVMVDNGGGGGYILVGQQNLTASATPTTVRFDLSTRLPNGSQTLTVGVAASVKVQLFSTTSITLTGYAGSGALGNFYPYIQVIRR
ncbi:MAG: hypothetical protein ABIQ89_01220 [Candidatus Saccharimonadales bacterium]